MKPFRILGSILGLVAPQAAAAIGGIEAIARAVTGDKDSPADVLEDAIVNDPELLAQVKQAAMEQEIEIEREKTKQLEATNATMQVELLHGTWYQKGWRPFNGYLFGISMFLSYPIPALLGKDIPNIPQGLWITWGLILGINANSRGQEKLARMGVQNGSIIENIGALFKKKK